MRPFLAALGLKSGVRFEGSEAPVRITRYQHKRYIVRSSPSACHAACSFNRNVAILMPNTRRIDAWFASRICPSRQTCAGYGGGGAAVRCGPRGSESKQHLDCIVTGGQPNSQVKAPSRIAPPPLSPPGSGVRSSASPASLESPPPGRNAGRTSKSEISSTMPLFSLVGMPYLRSCGSSVCGNGPPGPLSAPSGSLKACSARAPERA